jgi:hypothetical protein
MCFDCVRHQSEKALRAEYLDGVPGMENPPSLKCPTCPDCPPVEFCPAGLANPDGAPGAEIPIEPQAGPFTGAESAVLTYLVSQRGRWVPALEVAAQTGIRERGVRYAVRALVMRGEPIISMAGPGGGFRFIDDASELEADRARKRREALSLLYRLSRQDRTLVLQELAGQERISECGLSTPSTPSTTSTEEVSR